MIVAPATVNTINKWAAGICDTLALGILVEGIGLGLPIAAIPASNRAHTSHPAFVQNITRLRSWGVTVIWETGGYPAFDPVTGGNTTPIPWQAALDAKTGSARVGCGPHRRRKTQQSVSGVSASRWAVWATRVSRRRSRRVSSSSRSASRRSSARVRRR